jgi:hypothetical protein
MLIQLKKASFLWDLSLGKVVFVEVSYFVFSFLFFLGAVWHHFASDLKSW